MPAEIFDSEAVLTAANTEEETQKDIPFGAIESKERLDVYEMNLVHRRKRQVPPNPQINVNLQLALPPNIQPGATPPQLQAGLQHLSGQ